MVTYQRRLGRVARHIAPERCAGSSRGGTDADGEHRATSTLATALSFPLFWAGIALEDALAARHLWPRLRFPRSPREIFADKQAFFELVRDNQLPWGDASPVLDPGSTLRTISQLEGQTTEPAKNVVNTSLRLCFDNSVAKRHGGALGQASAGAGSVDVFVKFQCGRELKLYLQAFRTAVAPDASHREVQFYRRLAHRVPQRVARPYFADEVRWCNRVCLVLEHLGDMQVVTDWVGGSFEQLRAVAVAAAGMHAQWWARTSHDIGTSWIPAKQGLDYANFVGGFIKSEPEWYKEIWTALQRYFEAVPVTLVHGDCRLGNMMFPTLPGIARSEKPAEAAEGVPPVVFSDWEATNVGPALWDLAYLCTLSQGAKERRERQSALLSAYLAALGSGMPGQVTPVSPAEGLEQLELLQLVLFYVSASVTKNRLWSGHGNTTKDGMAWAMRVAQAVIDLTGSATACAKLAAALQLPAHFFRNLCTLCQEGLDAAKAVGAD